MCHTNQNSELKEAKNEFIWVSEFANCQCGYYREQDLFAEL